jgi:hypothetical protein
MGHPQLRPKAHQTGDATPWQILDVNLFRRFPLAQDGFYIEPPKLSLYATWASVLLHTTPEL